VVGFCWASSDPSDLVGPVIPSLLSVPREASDLRDILGLYFTVRRKGDRTLVKIQTRLESGPSWDSLRVAGESGLFLDEATVIDFLLQRAKGRCDVLTDFPTSGSKEVIKGNQYYISTLQVSEVRSALRVIGTDKAKNCYLRRNGLLLLEELAFPRISELYGLLTNLGAWCPFEPPRRKSSNP
jgi:hypothetical protein